MESRIERYMFRVQFRNRMGDYRGRIYRDEEERLTLQMWMEAPEQHNILLEVAPHTDRDLLWKHFHQLCAFRGVKPLEYRRVDPLGEWQPVPGA
ncbi:MAG: hypothetical protein KC620_00300 [Myxococcales bacterium]|nr:hypothetical protein [Myxococcales bacterium]